MEFVTNKIAKVVGIVEIHEIVEWREFASEERCGAKIMILSGRLTRRLLRKQGTEKVIFVFLSSVFLFSPLPILTPPPEKNLKGWRA